MKGGGSAYNAGMNSNTRWTRRRWLAVPLASVTSAGAGLGLVLGQGAHAQSLPTSFDVPQEMVAELLAKQFPKRLEFLQFFTVLLSNPKVRMLPGQNRLSTMLDGRLSSPMYGSQVLNLKALEISYGLRFDPPTRAVRLVLPRLEQFELPGVLDPVHKESMRNLGSLIATNALHDAAVHRFSEHEMLMAQGLGLVPGEVQVLAQGLRLQLQPPGQQ